MATKAKSNKKGTGIIWGFLAGVAVALITGKVKSDMDAKGRDLLIRRDPNNPPLLSDQELKRRADAANK